MTRICRESLMSLCVLGVIVGLASSSRAQEIRSELVEQLEYRFIGPDGNRAIAVVGEPSNPNVIYVGAASGGIFKTTDAGISWMPIFDEQKVSSIGSLAIAPSDANVVWAGTGETFIIRPAISLGDGIYKSTDAGKTWENVGLEKTGRIGRVVVDPRNSDVVLACAVGHGYRPQQERGVFRTSNGGETWERVLFVDESTGCSDIAMDPNNPRILFAGMWQLQIDTWKLDSGGPGSGIYVSRDNGVSWEQLSGKGKGLPGGEDHPIGKIAVAVAQSDSNRVYALVEDTSPGLYRSDDGGKTWRLMSQNHTMNERAPYYTRIAVAPDDEDRIYFASVRFSMSIDGGKTLVQNPPRGGGDTHDVWIDSTNPDWFMVADDGGVTVTMNRGKSFERHVLPIAQMYHVSTDNQVPYYVYGNRQDGYSYRGPSNSRAGFIPLGLWHSVGGCESGWAIPDPDDNDIVWSGCYDGGLERFDLKTGQVRNVRVWPEASYGWAPADVKQRWHWSFPLHISPHDHNKVYVGSQVVHQTTDGGQSWGAISPDLTLNDKERQQNSGGLTIDNLYTWDGAVLFAIAESPVEQGLIWTGSNDGQVQLTRDGGQNWSNVTKNIAGLEPWGTIANVEPSRFDAGTAYIAVDHHHNGDFAAYAFKTTDYGQSWKLVSSGIPGSPLSFAHFIREDPVRKGMLYLGTDNMLYVSLDDGAHWMSLQNNMPHAPIYWLQVQEHFNDIVVATYGRGFYILDDVTPLRALDEAMTSDTFLFQPRPAYRFQPVSGIKTGGFGGPGGSNVNGRNPPYGASLNFYVKEATENPVEIVISDVSGKTIRTLKKKATAGINRVWWNLRHEDVKRPKLRTAPPGRPWVPLGSDGTRPLVTWDLDLWRGSMGPLAPPGSYSVTVKAGEQELTQTVEVLKDPHSAGSEADIQAQVAFTQDLQKDLKDLVRMIDQIEWLRKQIEDLRSMAKGHEAILAAAKEVEEKAIAVEGKMFDINLTGAREDAFRGSMKLYGRYNALASDISGFGADFPPTEQQIQVHAVLRGRLEEARDEYKQLMEKDVTALNGLLQDKKLGGIAVRN